MRHVHFTSPSTSVAMQLPVRLYGRNRCDSKPIATTVRDAACFSSNPNGGRVFAADEVAAIARRDISKDMIMHITARASKTQALRLLCSSPINDRRLKRSAPSVSSIVTPKPQSQRPPRPTVPRPFPRSVAPHRYITDSDRNRRRAPCRTGAQSRLVCPNESTTMSASTRRSARQKARFYILSDGLGKSGMY
jgi:hypothetical protein